MAFVGAPQLFDGWRVSTGVSTFTFSTLRRAALAASLALPLLPAAAGAAPTATPVAEFSDASAISAGRGYLAVAVGSARNGVGPRTLYVGRRGALAPAKNVGELPSWARPHLGIDGRQVTTVVYPRCASAQLTTCKLYRYDVLTERESPVTAANRLSGALEGTLDHGRLVFARHNPKQPSSFTGQRSLYFAARPSAVPRLVTPRGGRDLALQGTRIAQVRDIDPTYGICGFLRLEVIDVRTGNAEEVEHAGCGMNGQDLFAPALFGDTITYGYRNNEPDNAVFRRNLNSRALERVRLPSTMTDWISISPTSGYLLEEKPWDDDTNPPATITRRSGLEWKPVTAK